MGSLRRSWSKMIHGDTIDEGGDDPNQSSCDGDGEDLGEALGVGS